MEADHLSRPDFSVIVPCFNDGQLAVEAIRSCLAQRGAPNLEVLLVDDGSRDGSAERVAQVYQGEPRVRVLAKPNGGLASARNHGLKHARGHWIVFLDSDDLLAPDYLASVQASLLGSIQSPDLVVLPFRYVCSEGRFDVRLLLNSILLAPRFGRWQAWNRFWIRVGNVLPVSSFVVATSLAERLHGFDETLKAHEDWEYWIRAIDLGSRIQYTRVHPDAATLITLRQGMSANRQLMADTHRDVRRRHCVEPMHRWINVRVVLLLLLGVRTVLGVLDGCLGRRINLTLP